MDKIARVAVIKTGPSAITEDYGRLLSLSEFKKNIPKSEELIIKLNLSWTKFFPACSSPPWQLDGVLNYLIKEGYDKSKLLPVENKTVVTDVMKGAENNGWLAVLKKYNINFIPLTEADWIGYKPKAAMLAIDKIIPNHTIPKLLIGKSILHLPTLKTHGHTTTTGAVKNAFGSLITEKRHHCHRHIHEVLVDLLAIQNEIHPNMFAVMDGTVCGDGAGPRTMKPKIKNFILASNDAVAIDAIAAKMMGIEPFDIPYLKIAHNLSLGNADIKQIEVIGEDVSNINFSFNAKKSPVIFFDRLLRSSFIGPLLFKTSLFSLCILGSALYHDYLWYPFTGRGRINQFMKSEWGAVAKRYGIKG